MDEPRFSPLLSSSKYLDTKVRGTLNVFQADSESVHDKVSPGLSKTMKVAYENAIKESHTKESKTSPPEEPLVGHALANTLKKKFESGEVREFVVLHECSANHSADVLGILFSIDFYTWFQLHSTGAATLAVSD